MTDQAYTQYQALIRQTGADGVSPAIENTEWLSRLLLLLLDEIKAGGGGGGGTWGSITGTLSEQTDLAAALFQWS